MYYQMFGLVCYRQRVILPAGMAETIEEFEINGLHSINTKTKNLEQMGSAQHSVTGQKPNDVLTNQL